MQGQIYQHIVRIQSRQHRSRKRERALASKKGEGTQGRCFTVLRTYKNTAISFGSNPPALALFQLAQQPSTLNLQRFRARAIVCISRNAESTGICPTETENHHLWSQAQQFPTFGPCISRLRSRSS
jgi:hypothetical protein